VQVKDNDGKMQEFTNQTCIKNAIWSNIYQKWFYLAEEAPICQKPLWGNFGYSAQTAAGRAVLAGAFQ
jgi:hypothetical protein